MKRCDFAEANQPIALRIGTRQQVELTLRGAATVATVLLRALPCNQFVPLDAEALDLDECSFDAACQLIRLHAQPFKSSALRRTAETRGADRDRLALDRSKRGTRLGEITFQRYALL